jgi:hypothetical protein
MQIILLHHERTEKEKFIATGMMTNEEYMQGREKEWRNCRLHLL